MAVSYEEKFNKLQRYLASSAIEKGFDEVNAVGGYLYNMNKFDDWSDYYRHIGGGSEHVLILDKGDDMVKISCGGGETFLAHKLVICLAEGVPILRHYACVTAEVAKQMGEVIEQSKGTKEELIVSLDSLVAL